MPHIREKNKQRVKPIEKKKEIETEEHDDVGLSPNIKKIIEIDEPEPVVGVIEEKVEDDIPIVVEDDESLSDETGLDDDEVDPFGDKYET